MSSIEVFNWALVLGCTATAAIFLAAMAVGDASRAASLLSIDDHNAALREQSRQFDEQYIQGLIDSNRTGPPEPQFPRLHQPHPHIDQYFIGYDPGAEPGSFSATWDDFIVKEPTE
jgi:hypothetical protein